MRRAIVVLVGLVLTSGVALAMFLVCHRATSGVANRQAATASPLLAPTMPRPVKATVVAATGQGAMRLGERMKNDDAVADDVTFLVVAALRGRCFPAQAHDLPRMAVMAGLPALSAGGGNAADSDQLRSDVRATVNDIVRRATCDGALNLHIGVYTRQIDPQVYAAAFPDSYFEPDLTVVPPEFKGVALSQRIADSCTRVAYAVLPLDSARAWQCEGLRASARSRVLQSCRAEGASPDNAAADIHTIAGRLPATCQ